MREILFRGKDIRGNWHIGLLAHVGNAWYISNEAGIATAYEVIPYTVGQYTGQTDKNGTKIFEGDIVRLVYNADEHIYQVVYDVSELDFKATNGKEEYRNNFQYLTCCDEVEVIGNIHDNPELAEGLL